MYVYIVASLRNTWFILERHTKNKNQNIYPADISGVVVYLGEIHGNRIPTGAAYILQQLNKHGYEAYIVGGCVRGQPARQAAE